MLVSGISAQNSSIAENIKNGSIDEKREALYQIKLLKSAEFSLLAALALKDANEIVRATAAGAIIYLPEEEALKYLQPQLKYKSLLVKKETLYSIGKIHSNLSAEILIEFLRREKNIELKSAAAKALGEIGDIASLEFLSGLLAKKRKDKEDFFRRSITRSIGQIAQFEQVGKSYSATPERFLAESYQNFVNLKHRDLSESNPMFRKAARILMLILQNPQENNDVKREAAYTLGVIGDQSAIEVLRQNLSSEDYFLVQICRESLFKLRQ